MKWHPAEDGLYYWKCGRCYKRFKKTTPQGIGMARANHLRKHGIKTLEGLVIR